MQTLEEHHTVISFSCGIDALDRYFQQQAIHEVRRRVAAAFVLVDNVSPHILGYYTLSAEVIDVEDLSPEIAKKLPRYPRLPATLIGRLAVAQNCQGQGIGEFLLIDALKRSLENASTIGSIAVVVDTLEERARQFYLYYDFIPFQDSPKRLFLPMKTIEKLLR
ncbi:MAG: GNAT family N-acetyltransferase [Candidatus Solibacter sp.]